MVADRRSLESDGVDDTDVRVPVTVGADDSSDLIGIPGVEKRTGYVVSSAQYVLSVSDENLAGALAGTDLVLTLMGTVSTVCDACDANCDGFQTIDDVSAFVDLLVGGAAPCSACAGDMSFNSVNDGGDVQLFVNCLLGL